MVDVARVVGQCGESEFGDGLSHDHDLDEDHHMR